MSHKPGILFYSLCCIINQPNNSLRSHKMTKTHTYVCWKRALLWTLHNCESLFNYWLSNGFYLNAYVLCEVHSEFGYKDGTFARAYRLPIPTKFIFLLFSKKMLIRTNRTSLSKFVWRPTNKYLSTYLLK